MELLKLYFGTYGHNGQAPVVQKLSKVDYEQPLFFLIVRREWTETMVTQESWGETPARHAPTPPPAFASPFFRSFLDGL